jgi:hypothetical protein
MSETGKKKVWNGYRFFVAAHDAPIQPLLILRNEPWVRSRGGKPHIRQELYRFAGENVS